MSGASGFEWGRVVDETSPEFQVTEAAIAQAVSSMRAADPAVTASTSHVFVLFQGVTLLFHGIDREATVEMLRAYADFLDPHQDADRATGGAVTQRWRGAAERLLLRAFAFERHAAKMPTDAPPNGPH